MKNIIAISTVSLVLVLAWGPQTRFFAFGEPPSGYLLNGYTQAGQEEEIVETKQAVGEAPQNTVTRPGDRLAGAPRIDSVKMVDFHLRNGQGDREASSRLIFGRLVLEDKNRITVERLDEGRIILSTYSKRDIDTRTLHITSMPQYKYYLELGEYFYSRTWDFKDDPDDFIQAIRCYEKARRLMQDSEKGEKIEQRLAQLKADKQVWEEQMQSRARLKTLEFEATIETKLKQLQQKVDKSCQQVDEGMKQLDKIVADAKDKYEKLERSISWLSKDLSRQLEILADRIEDNRDLIYRRCWYPRYYFYYRRNDRPDNDRMQR